jgi:hypothetical protein
MGFLAVALVVAVLVVVARRGSLRQLAQLPVEGFGMLFLALAIQAALGLVHIPEARIDDVGFGLLILSYACILGFCFANFRIRGMAIVTIGIALNAIVIALNQGMPADGPTRVDAQGRTVSTVTTSVKHRPQRPGDVLTVLDDRIVVRRPFHEILSFGDLILAIGLIDVCYWGSRRDERQRLSVFALTALPASAPPPPASVATPAAAASPVPAGEPDATREVEPVHALDAPGPPFAGLDLTAAPAIDDATEHATDDTEATEHATDATDDTDDTDDTDATDDAAWHITTDEPEPAEDVHRAESRLDRVRLERARHAVRADPARLDDETETALWLATP